MRSPWPPSWRACIVDRQVLDPVETRGAEATGRPSQRCLGKLVGDHVEHHLQLQAGEVGPDAVVRAAAAEGHVGIWRATDVEPRRVVEDLLVEVGGGEVQADALPL